MLLHLLTALASASSLFLVACGLSLIFGVTRTVNFAHGSLYMLGLYAAVALSGWWGASPVGYWGAVLAAALVVGVLGAAIERLVLARLYAAPDLYPLLATFALVLVFKDVALALWGAQDLLGPQAPGLQGAVWLAGQPFPRYDLLLIAIGPLVLGLLWLLLHRTHWGLQVRAATQDRDMLGALGVNPRGLFTSVFALGSFLAALGGALQMPHEPANLNLDMAVIGEAFVVVVVGGMGSITGAFVASLLIAGIKALCIAAGTLELWGMAFPLSRLTLVAEFIVMAVVLVWRPSGLLGRAQATVRSPVTEPPLRALPPGARWALVLLALGLLLAPLAHSHYPYLLVLLIDVLIAMLFAASLQWLMGPAGLHSFGHAAYFGLGAYGAALGLKGLALPMPLALLLAPLVAALAAWCFAALCARVSGVYLAMLTLAFAQILWSIAYQWDSVSGGSNGLVGIWPAPWLASRPAYYGLTLACTAGAALLLWRLHHAPLGLALRAARDAPLRAQAIGMNLARLQRRAWVQSAALAGLAGALFAFAKGTIAPDTLGVGQSVDGLVAVLLGGLHSVLGPWVGAGLFTVLQDSLARQTDYWRAVLGGVMLLLVLVFPLGIVGSLRQRFGKEPA